MKRSRKAKILSTLGPVSSSPEIIENLFIEGTDVFRLNFSHGSIEQHRKNCELIRNLERCQRQAKFISQVDKYLLKGLVGGAPAVNT